MESTAPHEPDDVSEATSPVVVGDTRQNWLGALRRDRRVSEVGDVLYERDELLYGLRGHLGVGHEPLERRNGLGRIPLELAKSCSELLRVDGLPGRRRLRRRAPRLVDPQEGLSDVNCSPVHRYSWRL
jgi:hypothetical protein